MDEFIPTELWAPSALIGFFVIAVWRGWLIPRFQHRERIADKDSVIESERSEKASWRKAAEVNAETATKATDRLSTVVDILESIQDVLEETSSNAHRRRAERSRSGT